MRDMQTLQILSPEAKKTKALTSTVLQNKAWLDQCKQYKKAKERENYVENS